MSRTKRLRINEVVEIKKLLQEGHSQREIERRTGISRTSIRWIKEGKTWSHVKIDKDGNYLPPQYLPEDYPVEYKIKTTEKVEIKFDWSTKYRQKFIDSYFLQKITHAKANRKRFKTKIEPVTHKSRMNIFGLWHDKKWLFNDEYDDFISFVMLIVTLNTMTFEPYDKDFDWSKVNDEGSKENLQLHGYLVESIRHRVDDYADKLNNTYQDRRGGELEYIKTDVKSMDDNVSEDGFMDRYDLVSDDNNFFKSHKGYFNNPLLQFLKENMTEVLTPHQIEFLQVYKYYAGYYRSDLASPYIRNYTDVVNKPYNKGQIDSYYQAIRKSTYKEFDPTEWTHRQVTNKRHADLLDGFNKAESKEDFLNEQLESSEYISNLIHDNLSVRELKQMNKCLHNGFKVNEDVISKIHRLINSQIDKLNKIIKGED